VLVVTAEVEPIVVGMEIAAPLVNQINQMLVMPMVKLSRTSQTRGKQAALINSRHYSFQT